MSCGSECPGGSDGAPQRPRPSRIPRRRPDRGRGPPRPPLNATYSRGAPQLNRTYTRASPGLNATYNRGAPELNRTYTRPSSGNAPCSSALNRTYTRPSSPGNATFNRGAPDLNRTFTRPGAGAALNRTLPRPGRLPPVPLPPPALDETYSRGPPALDRTFVQAPPRFGDTFSIHSLMDDLGEGDEWNESGALSIGDFEDDDEFEETLEDSGYQSASFSDESSCEPCEEEEEEEEEPEEDEAEEGEQLSAAEIREISANESHMSVYDAEELNRTTAPRSSDINVPRARIWQSLINTLNETENGEDMEFRDFVEGIQTQRRDRMHSSY